MIGLSLSLGYCSKFGDSAQQWAKEKAYPGEGKATCKEQGSLTAEQIVTIMVISNYRIADMKQQPNIE